MLLALLLACSDPCSPGPNPTLELGLGLTDFTPITEGATAETVWGPQGGFHVDLAVRAEYLDAGDLVSAQLEGYLGGERTGGGQPWFDLECRDDALVASGLRLIFFGRDAEAIDGQAIDVIGRVQDARGEIVEAEATITILATEPPG